MEQKTFIETSSIYNIHTGENNFSSGYFWRFCELFRFGQIKKFEVYFDLYIRVFFYFYREKKTK